LDRYKGLRKAEVVSMRHAPPLPHIVGQWAELRKAFTLRHRLAHGACTCSADYAAPKVAVLLGAARSQRSSALCPCFHDLTQNGEFANVVGVMIRNNQDFAQDGVLGRMG